jgi:hypothetical protein
LSPFVPRKKRNSRYFRGAKGDDYANPLFPQQKLLTHFTAMKRFVHPLLMLQANATDKDPAKMIEYLVEENRIAASRCIKLFF